MRPKRYQLLLLITLLLSSSSLILAQAQNSGSQSSETKRNDVEHRIQIQLLVASNTATVQTDYPSSIETVVKQLKSSLPFKNHRLVATYIYNVIDSSRVDVNDVTYTPFEPGGGLMPTFLKFSIAGIKLNPSGNSVHIARFNFEATKRIFTENIQVDGSNATRPVYNSVATGISTELNVSEGVPTIVGTMTSGLSDGVLVVVVTVNHSEVR